MGGGFYLQLKPAKLLSNLDSYKSNLHLISSDDETGKFLKKEGFNVDFFRYNIFNKYFSKLFAFNYFRDFFQKLRIHHPFNNFLINKNLYKYIFNP